VTSSRRAFVVNRYYYPDNSATAQILDDLCRHLAANGWTVSVITSRLLYGDPGARLPSREAHDGVAIHRVWTSRFGRDHLLGRVFDYLSFYVSATLALLAQVRRGDTVILKTDPPLISVPAGLAVRLRGGRVVNWLQDLYPEVGAQLGIRVLAGPIGRMLRALRNSSLRAARQNVAIGERMADVLVAEGVPRDRVTVVANWSDDDEIVPVAFRSGSLREAWGFGAEDFVVAYSGNLGRAHEFETLLDAAQRLAPQQNVRFLFIGGGHHREGLGRLVSELNLTSFSFQPYQSKARLAESLGAADVHWVSLRPQMEGLIVPSKFYGVAAAGRGVVCVTAQDGELARLVRANDCGLVIAPGDGEGLAAALAKLAADQEACQTMGRNARRMIETQFSKRRALERWARVLEGASGADLNPPG
jgi:glycosyltransferase involved in cell wall biosynthesis